MLVSPDFMELARGKPLDICLYQFDLHYLVAASKYYDI